MIATTIISSMRVNPRFALLSSFMSKKNQQRPCRGQVTGFAYGGEALCRKLSPAATKNGNGEALSRRQTYMPPLGARSWRRSERLLPQARACGRDSAVAHAPASGRIGSSRQHGSMPAGHVETASLRDRRDQTDEQTPALGVSQRCDFRDIDPRGNGPVRTSLQSCARMQPPVERRELARSAACAHVLSRRDRAGLEVQARDRRSAAEVGLIPVVVATIGPRDCAAQSRARRHTPPRRGRLSRPSQSEFGGGSVSTTDGLPPFAAPVSV